MSYNELGLTNHSAGISLSILKTLIKHARARCLSQSERALHCQFACIVQYFTKISKKISQRTNFNYLFDTLNRNLDAI